MYVLLNDYRLLNHSLPCVCAVCEVSLKMLNHSKFDLSHTIILDIIIVKFVPLLQSSGSAFDALQDDTENQWEFVPRGVLQEVLWEFGVQGYCEQFVSTFIF